MTPILGNNKHISKFEKHSEFW